MLPILPLLPLAAALLSLAAPPLSAQGGPDLQIPVQLEERTGLDQPAWPVALGVPLAPGELPSLTALEIDAGGRRLPAEAEVLSRWEDGSVRWMRVEFEAPALDADQVFEGTLRPRSGSLAPDGLLELRGGDGEPWEVDTGVVRLLESAGGGELFLLRDATGALLQAPARSAIATAAGELKPAAPAPMSVERQSALSVTLKQVEELEAADGHLAATLTTRVTLYRGSALVRIQQSLDILRGVHSMREWSLSLPVAEPGKRTWAPLREGHIARHRGDAVMRQTELEAFEFQGKEQSGAFPGVVAVNGLSAGLRHFRELLPTEARREGDALVFDFCPGRAADPVVLEEGFGRTMELWLRATAPKAAELQAFAGMLATPHRPHCTPEWYTGADAFGQLALAQQGDHAALEEKLAQSTDEILDRRLAKEAMNFGIQHFGDFFDREHTISYYGALQQEYDPGVVLFQQFLRSGDVDYLEPAMELAWHLVDVDMTPYGGCFQHRATKHHVDSWIAGIFAEDLAADCRAWSGYDGSLSSVLAWVERQWSRKAADSLDEWVALERDRGIPEEELEGRLFAMIGFHLVTRLEEQLPSKGDATIQEYARQMATLPDSRARGYDDAEADFAGFFQLYGGSWDEFPSFHVDNSPIPSQRHQPGHSVVQSVVLAHLLSGEPRFRERALAFGRHHHEELVPRAIATIERNRDRTNDTLYTRNLAWPVISLSTLVDLSCGMPEEQALRAEMLAAMDDCVDTLLTIPVSRVRSSIHAGMTLEGMAIHHQRSGRTEVADYLKTLARHWAATQYDWDEHAFRYRQHGATEAYHGMSGLVLYGLAYAEQLEHDEDLWAVIQDAWDHLPQKTGYAKSYAMLYRAAPRILHQVRQLRLSQP